MRDVEKDNAGQLLQGPVGGGGNRMARMVSFVVLVVILILIALLFFQVMSSFLLPLFLAALIGVVFQPLYRWTLAHCRGQRYVAATITTILVLLSVLAPAALVFTLAGAQGAALASQVRGVNVRQKLDELRKEFSLDIPNREHLEAIEDTLVACRNQLRRGETPKYDRIPNTIERLNRVETWRTTDPDAVGLEAHPESLRAQLETLVTVDAGSPEADQALLDAIAEFRIYKRDLMGGAIYSFIKEKVNPTDAEIESLQAGIFDPIIAYGSNTLVIAGKLLLGIIVMVAATFFFFAEGSRMLDAVIRLSPLEERYVRELVAEFDRVCRAVVAATLLSAVAQGILAGFGFYMAGLSNSVALLMLLTMVLAMVPFTGAASVWVPVCLYLYFFAGNFWGAVILAAYGTLIISAADNVIKPWVLHGQSNLHPLLALLSVIGGLGALGPIGILVGPMVVVFLQTLLKILQRELMTMDKLSAAASAAAAAFGVQLPPKGVRSATAVAVPEPPPIDPASGLPTESLEESQKPESPKSANGSPKKPGTPQPGKKKRRR
jgi:predicted PurR-regulated permease PerM